MRIPGLICCGIGIVFALVAAQSHDWRAGESSLFDYRVGLLSVQVYDQSKEESLVVPPSQLGPRGYITVGDHYVVYSTATYALSFGAAVLLLVAGAAFWRWDSKSMAKAAVGCCVLLLGTTIGTIVSWRGGSTITMGWPPWLSIIGGVAGLVGSLQLIRPKMKRTSFLLSGELWRNTLPMFRRSGRASGGLIFLGASKSTPAGDDEAESPPTEVVSAVDSLRYVAQECTFSDAGVRAVFADGHVSRNAWDRISSIVARKLPVGAPYNGGVIVDIVIRDDDGGSPQPPVRLTSVTRVRGAAGSKKAASSSDTLRLAARHVLHESPSASVGLDVMHFTQGKEPVTFASVQEFELYDSRFD